MGGKVRYSSRWTAVLATATVPLILVLTGGAARADTSQSCRSPLGGPLGFDPLPGNAVVQKVRAGKEEVYENYTHGDGWSSQAESVESSGNDVGTFTWSRSVSLTTTISAGGSIGIEGVGASLDISVAKQNTFTAVRREPVPIGPPGALVRIIEGGTLDKKIYYYLEWVDLCGQPATYSDGEPVPVEFGTAVEEMRTITKVETFDPEHPPNAVYDWLGQVGGDILDKISAGH